MNIAYRMTNNNYCPLYKITKHNQIRPEDLPTSRDVLHDGSQQK